VLKEKVSTMFEISISKSMIHNYIDSFSCSFKRIQPVAAAAMTFELQKDEENTVKNFLECEIWENRLYF
jgi:uncharacterized membrane-anchored protein